MDPAVARDRVPRGQGTSSFRRRHLIELHEQGWFPEVWRDLFRAGLGKAFVMFGISKEFSRALTRFAAGRHPAEVLDLCSGSGECSTSAWREALAAEQLPPCALVLSDLYPSQHRWAGYGPEIRYIDVPVDVMAIGAGLPRHRIMLNTIHHFPPEELRAFLRETVQSADGFCAVDRSARNWREMLMTVFIVPLAAAIITAFVIRPFALRNLLWGLLIPVIPLVALFDGIVSNLRSYTVEELRALVEDASASFTWEVGETPGGRGVPPMTYVIGTRREPPEAALCADDCTPPQ